MVAVRLESAIRDAESMEAQSGNSSIESVNAVEHDKA